MAFQCIRCKTEIDKNFKACPHCGEPVTDFLRRYADEPVDGKYKIVERLGAGGMGDVYKVTHTYLGTTRVIKVIRPQISESRDAHDRFLREARTATKIQHPNVAALHDFSALPDGSHYMVWEFIDGENIAQRIHARGVLQPRYAVRVIIQALLGLEAIHRAGIVHRDISPENIMITREAGGGEGVKIIDLGVAKDDGGGDSGTRVGVFVGKLRYASPEHLGFLNEGERIDGRADIFSLAMVLYEMLMGKPPFEATSPHEYVMLHSRETQFKPLDLPPDLPGGAQLQAALAKALDRDRNKRYATAREFGAALEEVERSLPDPTVQKTMHLQALDGDATIRTPLPFIPSAPGADMNPTIRTPLPYAPAAQTVIESRARHGGLLPFVIIGLILLLAAAAIAGVLFWNRKKASDVAPSIATVAETTTTQTPTQTASVAETNVDVVTTTPITITETTATEEPVLSTTTTRPRPQPKPAEPERTPAPAPAPAPVPVPVPQPASNVRTYIDGDSGDADVNEQLLADVRQQLNGVRTVAVRGSGDMHAQLVNRLRDDIGLTVADSADTVINFEATLEKLGRGRKRRQAIATITKSGRTIFRYQMPSEDFRVGDTPAEAFA